MSSVDGCEPVPNHPGVIPTWITVVNYLAIAACGVLLVALYARSWSRRRRAAQWLRSQIQ